MPTKDQHIRKAEGNLQFAESVSLTSQPNIDWTLIALFYAAVHFVEAYLADSGQHSRQHQTRENAVARDAGLRPIFKQYSDLKYFGSSARYEVCGFTAGDVTGQAIPCIRAIESHIRKLIRSWPSAAG